MNLFESHDYARCRALLVEWTLTLRTLTNDENSHQNGRGNLPGSFSSRTSDINSAKILHKKMEKFSRMISQQLEHNSLKDMNNKNKLNLDYIEIEIRLAEFETALQNYENAVIERF